jgi:hypothetical protein
MPRNVPAGMPLAATCGLPETGMTADNADFIAKLRQIEELAAEVHGLLPQAQLLLRTRVQHILVLAKTLRGRLELGTVALVPVEPPAEPKEPTL